MGGAAGAAPIGPVLRNPCLASGRARVALTVASMLVNTNDGFAGITALPISDLAVGESMSRAVVAWDAGTEANSEAAGTIRGRRMAARVSTRRAATRRTRYASTPAW